MTTEVLKKFLNKDFGIKYKNFFIKTLLDIYILHLIIFDIHTFIFFYRKMLAKLLFLFTLKFVKFPNFEFILLKNYTIYELVKWLKMKLLIFSFHPKKENSERIRYFLRYMHSKCCRHMSTRRAKGIGTPVSHFT